jgi:hypothetical protein
VFDEYRFHLTLTGKLCDSGEARRLEESLRACFAPACNEETTVSGICVCKEVAVEPAAGIDAQPGDSERAFMPMARFSFNSSQQ